MASHADFLRGSSRVPGEDCVKTQKNVCRGGYTGYGLSGVVRFPQKVAHPGVSHSRYVTGCLLDILTVFQ